MSDDAGGAGGPGLPQEFTVRAPVLKKLTPEQAEKVKKPIQEIFDFFDLDKSGYIVATEVEAVLRKANETKSVDLVLSEEQIKHLSDGFMRSADANVDAKVSFDELYTELLKEYGFEV